VFATIGVPIPALIGPSQQCVSVGHRVKIHKITPAKGKERGDLEIKDYVVLQKPLEQIVFLLLVP
jgi:hypothetical protein